MTRRITAFGDIHGDMDALRSVLRLLRLIDTTGRWNGGNAIAISLGDIVDPCRSGSCDWPKHTFVDLITYLRRLKREARSKGGDVILLFGNHELGIIKGATQYMSVKDRKLVQHKTLAPGSDFVRKLFSEHQAAYMVQGYLFVHSGISPATTRYITLNQFNEAIRAQYLFNINLENLASRYALAPGRLSRALRDPHHMRQEGELLCAETASALRDWGGHAVVAGHTITSSREPERFCGDSVIRIDTAMSNGFRRWWTDGKQNIRALEIVNNEVRLLKK